MPVSWRDVALLLAGISLLGGVACGSTVAAPAQPTATPWPTPTVVPLLPPPPGARTPDGPPEECGTTDFGLAAFAGHFNARDSQHYHHWAGPAGASYWVIC